ncbi:hypothetical protein SANTM175S_09464 [Streptomyces antimycoticus]
MSPDAPPTGTVRVAGFATAIRAQLLPIITVCRPVDPKLSILVREHEPAEALHLLANDDADLALTYDYNLARPSRTRGHDHPTVDRSLGSGHS